MGGAEKSMQAGVVSAQGACRVSGTNGMGRASSGEEAWRGRWGSTEQTWEARPAELPPTAWGRSSHWNGQPCPALNYSGAG